MRHYYFLLLIIGQIFPQEGGEILVWQNADKLEWVDFQGTSPNNPDFRLAVSNIQIALVGKMYENEVPHLKVEAQFIKNKSWTITSELESLNHEQIHFDISELYARKIRKRFKYLTGKSISDSNMYEKIYFELTKEHGKRQKEFDGDAYSSKEKENQWKLKIAEELEELKEYEYVLEE